MRWDDWGWGTQSGITHESTACMGCVLGWGPLRACGGRWRPGPFLPPGHDPHQPGNRQMRRHPPTPICSDLSGGAAGQGRCVESHTDRQQRRKHSLVGPPMATSSKGRHKAARSSEAPCSCFLEASRLSRQTECKDPWQERQQGGVPRVNPEDEGGVTCFEKQLRAPPGSGRRCTVARAGESSHARAR